MKLKIVQIGNSHGIRIPKSILEQCGMKNEVVLEMENNSIILKPTTINPREGWDTAFKKALIDHSDDGLLDDEVQNKFDQEEWEWK